MPLSPDQKKHLLIGGGVGALVILIGSAFFGGKKKGTAAHGLLSGGDGQAHEGHHHQKKRHDGQDDRDREDRHNGRGDYSGHKKRKKHKHHVGADILGRPQGMLPSLPVPEDPAGPIRRLNSRIETFTFQLGQTIAENHVLYAKMNPVWEQEILPFLREWTLYWRDPSKWGWNSLDYWVRRWNALRAHVMSLLPQAVAQREWPV